MRGLGPFLRDAWRLSRPYFVSEEKWSARLLLAAIIALNLLLVGMDVVLNFWNRAFYNALQDKDFDSFWHLLVTYKWTDEGLMPGFCGVAAVYVVVAVYRTYLSQWLRIRWRRWLTERFMQRWLSDRSYYRISLLSAVHPVVAARDAGDPVLGSHIATDNPDQRISEDLNDFVTNTLSLSIDLLSNIVSLVSFITILWTLSGPMTLLGLAIPGYMVWVALVYAAAGTVLTHLIGRPLAALNFRQQRVEADFRFALVRLRENVEGVALYHGEADEQRGLEHRFSALIANWWAIMQRTKLLNALINGYNQIAVVFPIVVAAPRFFSGAIQLGGLTQIAGAFGQVQSSMSWVVNSYAQLAGWRATVERLATFHRAMLEAQAAAGEEGVRVAAGAGEGYGLHDATLALPTGETLLDHAEMTLRPGQSVVVSGRSGSGKSTLFRSFAGIWPFGSGEVRRPAGSSLFLPQRPYIPLGTLRHAVSYPAAASDYPDDALRAALRAAGLGHLEPRLDEEDLWAQRLSGGEQQRLALARALLAKPDWLFLDEATASLDPEAETALYATLKRELPGTTIVSIAHRPTVAALHDRHLVFERGETGPGRLVEAG